MPIALDLLIIHVPKFTGRYRPYGEFMSVNLLPMGSLALADLAACKGFRTRILHLGLEWIEGGEFSPLPYLSDKTVRVAAIPLHWHPQAYDALRIAARVKAFHPDTVVLTGGYTASYFYRELLQTYPQVDAVIRGEAERPLIEFLSACKSGREWHGVSNLAWRDAGGIRANPIDFVAGESDLKGVSYADLRLLHHRQTYIDHMGMPFVWAKGLNRAQNRRHFHLGPTFFPLNIGRGCSGNCTWCGGGANAQKLINGRRSVVFRKPEQVAATVAEAADAGYEMVHMAFDPGREAQRYYDFLLPEIGRRSTGIGCYFESFSLPTPGFLKTFAGVFNLRESILALSPETGCERLRHHNKSFSFSNGELMETIGRAEALGLRVDLFFAMGIAGERYDDLRATADLRRRLRRRFKNIGRIWTSPISLEPAAPWQLDPQRFGIVATRSRLEDYVAAGSPRGGGLGYFIPGYDRRQPNLDAAGFERLLKAEKCRRHCAFHTNSARASGPWMARWHCNYMKWKTGRGIRKRGSAGADGRNT